MDWILDHQLRLIQVLAAGQVLLALFYGARLLGFVVANKAQRYRLPILAAFLLGSAINVDGVLAGAHDDSWRLWGSLVFWAVMNIGLRQVYLTARAQEAERRANGNGGST